MIFFFDRENDRQFDARFVPNTIGCVPVVCAPVRVFNLLKTRAKKTLFPNAVQRSLRTSENTAQRTKLVAAQRVRNVPEPFGSGHILWRWRSSAVDRWGQATGGGSTSYRIERAAVEFHGTLERRPVASHTGSPSAAAHHIPQGSVDAS